MKGLIQVDPPQTVDGKVIDFTPKYQTEMSATADLVANTANQPPNSLGKRQIVLPSRASTMIDCGLTLTVPDGYKAVITPTEPYADKGLVFSSNVFTGPRRVMVRARNMGKEIVMIEPGERIALLSVEPLFKFDFVTEK